MATHLFNKSKRGIADRIFYWSPTIPLEWDIALEVNTVESKEISAVSHYELGITPNLNWPNEEDMFKSYNPLDPDRTNARLYLINDLSILNNNIEYDYDKDLLYTEISEQDFKNIISHGYPEYLWAIRGYNKYGHVSAWSLIKKFSAIYQAPDTSFTIDNVNLYSSNKIIKLYGTKSSFICDIEINNKTGNSTFPNEHTWESDIVLKPGENIFNVRGIPEYGLPTSYKQVKTILTTGEIGTRLVPNSFDQFGALYGVDRLVNINESNTDYAERIKDVFIHPANSNLEGLHNSIARNLNLSYDDFALVVRPSIIDTNKRSDEAFKNLKLLLTTNYAHLISNDFYSKNEIVYINEQDYSLTPSSFLQYIDSNNDSIVIKDAYGNVLDSKNFKVDFLKNKIYLYNLTHKHSKYYITYPKKISTSITSTTTLNELKSSLESLIYNDTQIIDVTLSSDLTGSELADGLLRQEIKLAGNSRYIKDTVEFYGSPIRWTNLSIFHLVDEEFWDRNKNSDGNLYNTKIESYVDMFKNKAHRTWDQIILDEDVWDNSEESQAYLPGVLDAMFGYYRSSNLIHNSKFSFLQALDKGFVSELDKSILKYIGINKDDIKSGIGDNLDLKVTILKPTINEQLTAPNTQNINISWYITGQVDEINYLPNTPYGAQLFSL